MWKGAGSADKYTPKYTIWQNGIPAYVVPWGEAEVINWCASYSCSYDKYNEDTDKELPRMQ